MGINIDVGAARYSNLDIIATQQDCAIFLGEEGEVKAIYYNAQKYKDFVKRQKILDIFLRNVEIIVLVGVK